MNYAELYEKVRQAKQVPFITQAGVLLNEALRKNEYMWWLIKTDQQDRRYAPESLVGVFYKRAEALKFWKNLKVPHKSCAIIYPYFQRGGGYEWTYQYVWENFKTDVYSTKNDFDISLEASCIVDAVRVRTKHLTGKDPVRSKAEYKKAVNQIYQELTAILLGRDIYA